MPKTVNVQERELLVSEAAWRVLVRDGLTELSVRKVAAEAGLPPSSLRYTFPTQASVRDRAIMLLLERMSARVARATGGDSHPADASGAASGPVSGAAPGAASGAVLHGAATHGSASPVDQARGILLELLPLDEERRIEMEVSLALGAMAMTDEALRATHEQSQRAVGDFCAQALAILNNDGHKTPTLDVRATHALIDGLALHLVRQRPDDDTDWAVAVLDAHVRGL